MDNNFFTKKISVIYKHSRLAYAKEKGTPAELKHLQQSNDVITKELVRAHENNLKCLSHVSSVLDNLGLAYSVICRSDIVPEDVKDRLIISVGGDGTLLDTSHHCEDSPILGVNSDPEHSIGALCIATQANFEEILQEIFQGSLKPSPIQRLSITKHNRVQRILALNDVLFCHQNPAAMSRFFLTLNGHTEAHRASGIWVSTAAGSTGGIFSSGSKSYPIEYEGALFRVREPYCSDTQYPKLLAGTFGRGQGLTIRSNMTDGKLYIDGPHKHLDIPLGDSATLALAAHPLWLFNGQRLNQQRLSVVSERLIYRKIFLDGEDGA